MLVPPFSLELALLDLPGQASVDALRAHERRAGLEAGRQVARAAGVAGVRPRTRRRLFGER